MLCQSETSSQLLSSFTVNRLQNNYVNILSVFSDKLLVSVSRYLPQLLIYSREGHHLTTIAIKDNDTVLDAAWTPQGNIVYTTVSQKEVVMISESGNVIISYTQMTLPLQLSVSNDNIIYLADFETGVYQSTDGCFNWTFVFKPIDEWHFHQVIKMNRDHSADFWTLGRKNNNENWHLRVYSVGKRRSDGNMTWRNIDFPTSYGNQLMFFGSSLSYDGNMNIFFCDFVYGVVHVFLMNGQYHCQLLSSNHLKKLPDRVAVDKDRQLLYVGQNFGLVEVFKLTYGTGSD